MAIRQEQELKKKGFAGLTSLVSDIEEEMTSYSKPQSSSPSRTGARLASSPPKDSLLVKLLGWSIFIGFICILFWILMLGIQKNLSNSSKGKSLASKVNTSSDSTRSRSAPSKEFAKPAVGTTQLLSVEQKQWCLREKIRIEGKRSYVNTNSSVGAFNQMVSDYNLRCGKARYGGGSLVPPRRDVDEMLSQIVKEIPKPLTTLSPSPAATQSRKTKRSQNSSPEISKNISKPRHILDVPSFEGSLVPLPGSDPVKGAQFNEFMLNHSDQIVYLSIYLTDEMSRDISSGADEFKRIVFTVIDNHDQFGTVGNVYLFHLATNSPPGFDFNNKSGKLSGYFKIWEINGPQQGWWSVNIRPVSANAISTKSGKKHPALIVRIQSRLKELGYNPGTVDGVYGKNTREAIKAFERDIGEYPEGKVTENVYQMMLLRESKK